METKIIEEFYWKDKSKGLRQSVCIPCRKEKRKASWAAGTEKAGNYEAKARRVKAAQDYIWEVLTQNSCADCSNDDPLVLEFDHVRGEKKADLAKMVYQNFGIEAIKAEVAKCEVVCRNCHSVRTQKRANSWRVQRLTAD